MNLKTGSNDPDNFGRAAKVWVDPKTNEAYVADGYRNKRVAVLDADTGKLKRYWGAYGNKPDDADLGKYDPSAPPPKQFRNPVHCVERSNDGLVYVCDRQADRIQVFNADGTFVKEAHFAKTTLGSGSAWDLAFSRDPQQRYLFLADGMNECRASHRARLPAGGHKFRRWGPPAGAVLRRAQHRDGFQGQHLHGRNVRRQAPAEVRVQGDGESAAEPGCALATWLNAMEVGYQRGKIQEESLHSLNIP